MPIQHRFSPYMDNGGTVLGIAGKDFAIIASDTRQSQGFSINSRDVPKSFQLTEKAILGLSGCRADVTALIKQLRNRIETYGFDHDKPLTTLSLARMLHTTLYYRRFLPFYTGPILVGLDEDGVGAVFRYDPVGSYQRSVYETTGTSSAALLAFLDNQVGQRQQKLMTDDIEPLSLQTALKVAKDAFISATERDIYTGDKIDIAIITKDGIKHDTMKLKED